jgi:hypothetical protein
MPDQAMPDQAMPDQVMPDQVMPDGTLAVDLRLQLTDAGAVD